MRLLRSRPSTRSRSAGGSSEVSFIVASQRSQRRWYPPARTIPGPLNARVGWGAAPDAAGLRSGGDSDHLGRSGCTGVLLVVMGAAPVAGYRPHLPGVRDGTAVVAFAEELQDHRSRRSCGEVAVCSWPVTSARCAAVRRPGISGAGRRRYLDQPGRTAISGRARPARARACTAERILRVCRSWPCWLTLRPPGRPGLRPRPAGTVRAACGCQPCGCGQLSSLNMSWPLAVCSGRGWITSQCSTIFPSRSLKKSMPAVSAGVL